MKEPIQLATLTVDLSKVSEIIEYDDHILLAFGADDDLPVLKLTGADAEAMRKWLDADWQHYLEYLDSRNEGSQVPRKRPRYHPGPEPSDISEEPPF